MSGDVRMRGFGRRASVAEAQSLIAQRLRPLGVERVPFRQALGRILAEDLLAEQNVPAHPRSAMDGYAVRAQDLPGRARVIGQILAAQTFDGHLGPQQAVRIMTGGKIPGGADAVVMVEDAKVEGDEVIFSRGAESRQHILETGCDLTRGAVVLSRGRRIRPQDLSLLATIGALEVPVQRRPVVRIVPSGTELIPPGRRPTGTEIVESNSFLLEALVRRDGGRPELHPIIGDSPEVLRQALSAPGADLVVVTGGSSVGQEDFAPVIARELGELPIHGIQVKPASPTGIGFTSQAALLLAPGYPVATFVAWDLFGRPMLERLGGAPSRWPYRRQAAVLAEPLKKPADRVDVIRVLLEPDPAGGPARARPIPGGASLLSTVTRADGFVLFEAGTEMLAAGAPVEVDLYEF